MFPVKTQNPQTNDTGSWLQHNTTKGETCCYFLGCTACLLKIQSKWNHKTTRGRKSSIHYRAVRNILLYIWPQYSCNAVQYNMIMIHPDSKVHGPTWGPSGSCRPQMGPILAPWTLLSGQHCICDYPGITLSWDRTYKYTPYLALKGELSVGALCKDYRENWPWYNMPALYIESLLYAVCGYGFDRYSGALF